MAKYIPPPAPITRITFSSHAAYQDWHEDNPTCACDFDDYEGVLRFKLDCPTHGEVTKSGYIPREATPAEVQEAWKTSGVLKPDTYEPPPDHYSTGAGIDPWAVWDAFDLDRYTANATKYLLRAGKKTGESRLKDLQKARNYVLKAIEMEGKQ